MRILIVDDESINRFLLRHMLEEQGFTDCLEAQSGEEALAIAQASPPDLVLLDVIMPGLTGYEVAPKLKSLDSECYLPIIFITSLDDKESLARCLDVGGDDFVSKPYDRVILAAKITAHNRTRELSKRIQQQNSELLFYQQAVAREHSIVEHIFANAIVNNKDVEKLFDVHLSPASDFNGDLFLCEASPSGGCYFILGDFTGHGLASAIGALPVTQTFTHMTRKGVSVGEIAIELNRELLSLLPTEMFFVAAIVEIDASGTRFTVWNGGMPAVIISSPAGQLRYRFVSQHMALGILDDRDFENICEVYTADEGDRLFAYTDGLMELADENGDMLEESGVEEWFASLPNINTATMYDRALAVLNGRPAHDDISLVMYDCRPLPKLLDDEAAISLPFKISVALDSDTLKRENAIEQILDVLNSQKGVERIRAELFTIVTEMFNNALEHGLLKLDSSLKQTDDGFIHYYMHREQGLQNLTSGEIIVDASYNPNTEQLTIAVTDSGEGFDPASIVKNDDYNFGRGIDLLQNLCDEVTFSNGGKTTQIKIGINPSYE